MGCAHANEKGEAHRTDSTDRIVSETLRDIVHDGCNYDDVIRLKWLWEERTILSWEAQQIALDPDSEGEGGIERERYEVG